MGTWTANIPWYTQNSYMRLKRHCHINDSSFRPSYEEWLKKAHEVQTKIEAWGGVVHRIDIHPETYWNWRISREHLPLNQIDMPAYIAVLMHQLHEEG